MTGAPGIQGPPGFQGPDGFIGEKGYTGVTVFGPRGEDGRPGEHFYSILNSLYINNVLSRFFIKKFDVQ